MNAASPVYGEEPFNVDESAANNKKGRKNFRPFLLFQDTDIGPSKNSGAGNESRTRDLNLGKVALYQLSYSRIFAI